MTLLSFLFGGGCDTFRGSVLALSIASPFPITSPQLPPSWRGALTLRSGQHLEIWARLPKGSGEEYVRLAAQVGSADPANFAGFDIVPAIDPNDPCLIRALNHDDEECAGLDAAPLSACGTQAFSKPAQIVPEGSTAELAQLGLVLQARKVTWPATEFRAVDPALNNGMPITGRAPSPLLAMVEYNPDYMHDPRIGLPTTDLQNAADLSVAQQRLGACMAYRDTNPMFYVGNPRQYTKPLAGILFGFFAFSTAPTAEAPDLPSQNFNGITFSVPIALTDIMGLLVTYEPTPVPSVPTMTQQLFMGVRQPDQAAGRGVIKLVMFLNTNLAALDPPSFTQAVGTAAVVTNLGERLD